MIYFRAFSNVMYPSNAVNLSLLNPNTMCLIPPNCDSPIASTSNANLSESSWFFPSLQIPTPPPTGTPPPFEILSSCGTLSPYENPPSCGTSPLNGSIPKEEVSVVGTDEFDSEAIKRNLINLENEKVLYRSEPHDSKQKKPEDIPNTSRNVNTTLN